MDAAERFVKGYLRHCGYSDICHHPDGDVPPDFLVHQRIAVEVRRLNQQHDVGTGPKGLEDTSIRLGLNVRKLLLSLGVPTRGQSQSWVVTYRFTRSELDGRDYWKALRSPLKRTLKAFMTQANPQPLEQKIVPPGFHLVLRPANRLHDTFFVPGVSIDLQAGGWMIGVIVKSLEFCIAEKTRKIADVRHKYPEWWLVMPDLIDWGVDDLDQQAVREQITIQHPFDRVICSIHAITPVLSRSKFYPMRAPAGPFPCSRPSLPPSAAPNRAKARSKGLLGSGAGASPRDRTS